MLSCALYGQLGPSGRAVDAELLMHWCFGSLWLPWTRKFCSSFSVLLQIASNKCQHQIRAVLLVGVLLHTGSCVVEGFWSCSASRTPCTSLWGLQCVTQGEGVVHIDCR